MAEEVPVPEGTRAFAYLRRVRALGAAHGGEVNAFYLEGPRRGLVLEWRGTLAGRVAIVICNFAAAPPHVDLTVQLEFAGPKRPKCIITLGGRHWASSAPSSPLVLPGGDHMTAHCEDLALVEAYVAAGLLEQLARLVPLGTPFVTLDGDGVMVIFQRGAAADSVDVVVQVAQRLAGMVAKGG